MKESCSVGKLDDVEKFSTHSLFERDHLRPMNESCLVGALNKVEKEFKSNVQMATKANSDDVFPEEVEYPRRCGSICRTTSTVKQVALYDHLVHGFAMCAGRFGVGRGLSSADVLLVLEIYSADVPLVPVAAWFLDLREARGAIGATPAGHMFFRVCCTVSLIVVQ